MLNTLEKIDNSQKHHQLLLALSETHNQKPPFTMAAESKNSFETNAKHHVEFNLLHFNQTGELRALASACCPYVPESDYRYLEDETQREEIIAKDKEFFRHLLKYIETLDSKKFAPHLENYSYLKDSIKQLTLGLESRKVTVGRFRTALGNVCYDEFLDLLDYP